MSRMGSGKGSLVYSNCFWDFHIPCLMLLLRTYFTFLALGVKKRLAVNFEVLQKIRRSAQQSILTMKHQTRSDEESAASLSIHPSRAGKFQSFQVVNLCFTGRLPLVEHCLLGKARTWRFCLFELSLVRLSQVSPSVAWVTRSV